MIDDLRFEIHAFQLLSIAFLPLPFVLSHKFWTDLSLYAPPSRGGVARIVPEFCARGTPEKRVTPGAARNKKCFARGVFYLLSCCTNVVILTEDRGRRTDDRGWRAGWELTTENCLSTAEERGQTRVRASRRRRPTQIINHESSIQRPGAMPTPRRHVFLAGSHVYAKP